MGAKVFHRCPSPRDGGAGGGGHSLLPFGSAARRALFAFLLQSKYPKLPHFYLPSWDTGPGKRRGRSGEGEEGAGGGGNTKPPHPVPSLPSLFFPFFFSESGITLR